MKAHVSLPQVVRAQVSLMFGKFRPAGGLTPDEQAAIRAERIEFGDRLVSLVRGIDAPEAALIEQVRSVTREVYADERLRNLPSVEGLCGMVKRAFTTRVRTTCVGCAEMRGHYRNASPDAPLLPPRCGDVEYDKHGWLCLGHHHAVHWYEHRERRRRGIPVVPGLEGGPQFEYAPPSELLPCYAHGAHAPADDPKWESWTDGLNMGPLARWARAFVLKVYGHEVGGTQAPLLSGVQEQARAESDEWRNL